MDNFPINNLSISIVLLIRIIFIFLNTYIILKQEEFVTVKFILILIFHYLISIFLLFSFCKCKISCKNNYICKNLLCSKNPIAYFLLMILYYNPFSILFFLFYFIIYYFIYFIIKLISINNFRFYLMNFLIIFDFISGISTLINDNYIYLQILLGILEIVSAIACTFFIINIYLNYKNKQQIIHYLDENYHENENINELSQMNLNGNIGSQILNVGEGPAPEINKILEENINNNEQADQGKVNNDEEKEYFQGR